MLRETEIIGFYTLLELNQRFCYSSTYWLKNSFLNSHKQHEQKTKRYVRERERDNYRKGCGNVNEEKVQLCRVFKYT